MAIRVAHLSFSAAGGAGGVASIVNDEQRRQGMDSTLVTHIRSNLRGEPLSAPAHTLAAAIDEYLVKSARWASPISVARDAVESPALRLVESADLVHLHGVNGMVSPTHIAALAKTRPIVWTLHDMNPFTGACHYALACEGFVDSCSRCPAVRSPWRTRVVSARTAKQRAYGDSANLFLVAPSTWLAEEAQRSGVFDKRDVRVIPNPVAHHFVQENSPTPMTTSEGPLRLIVVAQHLDDPVKEVATAVGAFRALKATHPGVTLTLVGRGGRSFSGLGVTVVPPVSSGELVGLLDRADVLVVASRAENAPLVIAEAAARGVTTIARDVGGIGEMLDAIGHGQLVGDSRDLVQALERAASDPTMRSPDRRADVASRARRVFSPASVVAEYAKVYAMATDEAKGG